MALPKVVVQTRWPRPIPRGRLLDVIEALPQELAGDDGLKWLNGVQWNPKPCRGLLTSDSDACDPTDFSETSADYFGCTELVTQLAFQLYEVFRASPLEGWNLESMEAEQRPHMDLLRSWAFARELMNGAASGGGHSLASEATAPNGAAFGDPAQPIWNALPILESELAERLRGGQGMIHLAPGLLSQAVSTAAVKLFGDHYETALGNIVVADAGYLDMTEPTGQAASATGTDWVYASGPVWYRSTEPKVLNTDANQGTDISRDELTQFLASRGIVVFDPCPVTAILTSYDQNG